MDALFTNDPAATSAIELGVARLIDPDIIESPQYIIDPFLFGSFNIRKDWADKNKDTVGKIITSLNEAIKFIDENPGLAKETMLPYMPDLFKPHVQKYPDAKFLSTRQSTVLSYKNTVSLYKDIGVIPEYLELDGLVVTDWKH